MLFCSTPDCTWNMLLWHSSCLAWPAVLTPNKLPSPFLLFVFQGVFPCMEYSSSTPLSLLRWPQLPSLCGL